MEVKPTPEYEKQYLDASYNAADCWHKYAIAQTTDKERKKMLGSAYKSIRGTAAMMPNLGGGETWAKFNSLYRIIEQDMLELGMPEMKGKEVVDLERALQGCRREELAAAKKAAQENAAAVPATPTWRPTTNWSRRKKPRPLRGASRSPRRHPAAQERSLPWW